MSETLREGVERLHYRCGPDGPGDVNVSTGYCHECVLPWPCPTAALLAATAPTPDEPGQVEGQAAGLRNMIEFLPHVATYLPPNEDPGGYDTCVVCRDSECGGDCPDAVYVVRQVMEAWSHDHDLDWWRDEFGGRTLPPARTEATR